MVRLILLLTALLLPMLAMSDDDKDEGRHDRRGDKNRTMKVHCETQANQRDLVGKERGKFIKECNKNDRRGRRHGHGRDDREDRDGRGDHGGSVPSHPAPPQPSPVPALPPATIPPVARPPAPPPPRTVAEKERKRLHCLGEATRKLVPPHKLPSFMDECMAR